MAIRQFEVVGRRAPTDKEANPPAYRMKLFAENKVLAVSRFWYFMGQLRKMKRATGEILNVSEITEKNSRVIKNYSIWIRYNSRSGTHNMVKEYRDLTLCGAVAQMYSEMAGLHRARRRSIQIMRTAIIPASECTKPTTLQFINSKISFPLAHRVPRAAEKKFRSTFKAQRPTTYVN